MAYLNMIKKNKSVNTDDGGIDITVKAQDGSEVEYECDIDLQGLLWYNTPACKRNGHSGMRISSLLPAMTRLS